jgi:hypothetical protein
MRETELHKLVCPVCKIKCFTHNVEGKIYSACCDGFMDAPPDAWRKRSTHGLNGDRAGWSTDRRGHDGLHETLRRRTELLKSCALALTMECPKTTQNLWNEIHAELAKDKENHG